MLVCTKIDDYGAVHSFGRNLSSDEVETALRVFLRSSDAFSLIVRKHKDFDGESPRGGLS